MESTEVSQQDIDIGPLQFERLPGLADFILTKHLDAFILEMLQVSREVELPMLNYFSHLSDTELLEISREPHSEILRYWAQNRAAEQIALAQQRWVNDQLVTLGRDDVAAEDITLASYVRKAALSKFVPLYTAEPQAMLELLREIDVYSRVADTASLETYGRILNNRVKEQRHFNERVADTTPGIVYIYNYADHTEVYTNRNLFAMLGYSEAEIKSFGTAAIATILHPDDFPRAIAHIGVLGQLSDGETRQNEYRVKDKQGQFRWMRTYESVFARNADGTPSQIIGVAFDVDNEKSTLARLEESEALNRQAQALARIGSWRYDIVTQAVTWSDELYSIYGLKKDDPINFEKALSFTNDEDRERVFAQMQDAVENRQPYTTRYRITDGDGNEKILINRAHVFTDEKGNLSHVVGSIQDITDQDRLVAELEESQRLYRQAQTLAHLGNWSYDEERNVLSWSDELYRIFGLDPGTPVDYEKFLSHIHPDEREALVKYVNDSLAADGKFRVTNRIVTADGRTKYIEQRGERSAPDGKRELLFGTSQDITQQVLVENQLRENQNFIQKIADATPSLITSYNINTGKYQYISGGLTKLLGYDATLALKEGVEFFVRLMHPDDVPVVMQENNETLAYANAPENQSNDNIVTEFRYRMRHADGRFRWFHTYGTVFSRDQNGLVENVLNISLDITEGMEAEQRLRERERFIGHVADASPTVLFVYDLGKQSVLYINEEVRYALGYAPDEVLAMGNLFTPTLFHPEDILKTPEHNYRDNERDLLAQYECRMKHADGSWRWMLVREVVYERDDNGMAHKVLGSALDITERKLIERSLTQKTLELQQTNANLAEFAYVASHDLKEPLRKIQVFGDRIQSKEAERLSEAGKDWFRRMQSAAARMDLLIDDLLSFSRTNTNEKPPEPSDLTKLLDVIRTDLSAQIEREGALVQAGDLPTVNVVPVQFRQLMQNLVSNAIKFHKPGVPPRIRITAETLPGNEILHPQAEKNKYYVKLSFADNGIGFDPEFAERIFGLFQRLHGKGEYPGTGIGLALCKKVAENHGGFIVANGKPGEGAVFDVYVPKQ